MRRELFRRPNGIMGTKLTNFNSQKSTRNKSLQCRLGGWVLMRRLGHALLMNISLSKTKGSLLGCP